MANDQSNLSMILGLTLGLGIPVIFGLIFGLFYVVAALKCKKFKISVSNQRETNNDIMLVPMATVSTESEIEQIYFW